LAPRFPWGEALVARRQDSPILADVKKIIDALSENEGLTLEGRLILLGLVTDCVIAITRKLEDELATRKDGLVQ